MPVAKISPPGAAPKVFTSVKRPGGDVRRFLGAPRSDKKRWQSGPQSISFFLMVMGGIGLNLFDVELGFGYPIVGSKS